MSSQPPPLPRPPEPVAMRNSWITWIVASTLMPALPFMVTGKKGLDHPEGFIVLALLCQFGASIWLAVKMSEKLRRGQGYVVLMSVVFLIASVIIGSVSFFAACLVASPAMNFH